jgi:SAM-dependent methyltransferase
VERQLPPKILDPDASAGVDTHLRVAQLIDPPGDHYVIDAGAGHGSFTDRLVIGGYRAVAAEFKLGNFWCDRAPHVICDLDVCLPFASGTADGVVAIEIIEHMERPLLLVREAARCLRNQGWLVVTTPNILHVASRLSYLARGYPKGFSENDYRSNGHISPVSLTELRRIGERAGLAIEAVTYNVGRLPVPKIYGRVLLRSSRFRTGALGESLIVLFRKIGDPITNVYRG